VDDVTLELSDDELREQMDMHTIIVSCLNDEPLFTAEQVGLPTNLPTYQPTALPGIAQD
jgi:hypothetical protein